MYTKQFQQSITQKTAIQTVFQVLFYNKLDIGINQMYYFA